MCKVINEGIWGDDAFHIKKKRSDMSFFPAVAPCNFMFIPRETMPCPNYLRTNVSRIARRKEQENNVTSTRFSVANACGLCAKLSSFGHSSVN